VNDHSYTLRNLGRQLPEHLAQYLEAQYHIYDEHLVRERQQLLWEAGVIHQAPYVEATPSYVAGRPYAELSLPKEVVDVLAAAVSDGSTGIPRTPYAHQAQALESFFRSGEDLVVSTGTGSGKTESFLMPIMGTLATEKAQRPSSYALPGVRALLLYPMNALVNDQVARLRRLLDAPSVKDHLARPDWRSATFGMYTSRTFYAGAENGARTEKDVGGWIDRFFDKYRAYEGRLRSEGKWPAKDLGAFRVNFTTAQADVELFTRQEMQHCPPDMLVTNYSMLEYMLLRPVEAPIFDRTAEWLEADAANQLIIVLDEAHLYQGAQGAEVALLLRRLASRLRISRDRIRFILTSASLAEGEGATERIRHFAALLTGVPESGRAFAVVIGQLDKPAAAGEVSDAERAALANLDISALQGPAVEEPSAIAACSQLLQDLGGAPPGQGAGIAAAQDALNMVLGRTVSFRNVAAAIMGSAMEFSSLAQQTFGDGSDSEKALDGLLAAAAFARRASDGKILLPSRAHLLFRGLEGVFACTNPNCTECRIGSGTGTLGRLYASPRQFCACGGKVFELLTHRDCGAAFLRGYFRPADPDFLWHEPSTGVVDPRNRLSELHLLVEASRDQSAMNRVWMHIRSGRLQRQQPADGEDWIELREHRNHPVQIQGRTVYTFDRQCPVCLSRWQDPAHPKIMDLVTKGEDPFSHLIATQVRLQPQTSVPSRAAPNGGRKTLIFSDGRQRAARLSRDVPRVLEQDAFRQALVLAANEIQTLGLEPRLSDPFIYVAFVAESSKRYLSFFDGDDQHSLLSAQDKFQRLYRGSLQEALQDGWGDAKGPARFRIELMRTLGNRHYSVSALGIAYVAPRRFTGNQIAEGLAKLGIPGEEAEALGIVWIQGLLEDMSIHTTNFPDSWRTIARGGYSRDVGSRTGFAREFERYLREAGLDPAAVVAGIAAGVAQTAPGTTDRWLLEEGAVKLVPALDKPWYRCTSCTFLSPVVWRKRCTACGKESVLTVDPDSDPYLRARKDFWRKPVERVLSGVDRPQTLDVQEHTAQLAYRDTGDIESTTESFERRFRDILIDDEHAIDVLSCTTTMEVGIDIGSLIAVSMRNMPPSRHNYQQRAGRAGRRGSAVSSVVTFAQNNPHDAHLFEHPKELIAGKPSVHAVDVENAYLAARHTYAELLQEYFRSATIATGRANVFATLGRTKSFFEGTEAGSLHDLRDWLSQQAEGVRAIERIGLWLPKRTGLTGRHCADRLLAVLDGLTQKAMGDLPTDEENLIEFLFANGVLPAYAFPRDLIALEIQKPGSHETEQRPQQGARVALSEYAPGRTVVVNKRTYRVGAVTAAAAVNEQRKARPLFEHPGRYLQCANCLNTMSPETGVEGQPCPVCAASPMDPITVIQPQVAWPQDGRPVDEFDDEQEYTETTLAQLPVPASDSAFESPRRFGARSEVRFGRQVPLVIVNRGQVVGGQPKGFRVCRDCGHVPQGDAPFEPHRRHYRLPPYVRAGDRCNGAMETVYLGYEFQTDVVLVRTQLSRPFASDIRDPDSAPQLRAACMSLSAALALAAADTLGVDQRELESGHRLRRMDTGESFVELFMYDSIAGGAGYSKAVGEAFEDVFAMALRRLADCDCHPSCSRCLRTYQNRMSHSSLDRRLGHELGVYIQTGVAPEVADVARQRAILRPLAGMLDLAGWQEAASRNCALEVERVGVSSRLHLRPSLRDPDDIPNTWRQGVVFSQFEVEKDLPSCILKMP
jgi:ATP-dependent helicase YprA (DUF1998 family)